MELKPGYKQTEVWVIPEDWDVVSIGSVASFKSGDGISVATLREKSSDNPIPVYGGNGIAGYTTDALVQERVVVVGRVGQRCGEVYLTAGPAWISDNALYPRIFHRRVDICYFAFALGAAGLNDVKNRNDLPLVTQAILHSAIIRVPSRKAEQEAIAEALSDSDALIGLLGRLIVKKRCVKHGAMQELLTGRRRLPGFNGDWVAKRLGSSATLKARIGWQGLTTAEYLDSGEYLLVTGTELRDGYVNWSDCHYVAGSRYQQDKYIQLREQDVLVTKDGTIGKVAIVKQLPGPATLNSGIFVIRPIDGAFHPAFFYFLLCSASFEMFLGQLSAGSTINHLYQKDFGEFVYDCPATIEEQTAIASILTDLDAEIAALEAKLAKARAVKQGMMQELLAGRIRLVRPVEVVQETSTAKKVKTPRAKSHNWEINEAVVISVLAQRFGSEEFPLGRKRCTKLSYLLHRHVEREAQGYLKKAAGPYNPSTKYKGPEAIALKNRYVRRHAREQFSGFVAAEKIGAAEKYFSEWYGEPVLTWLDQFRYKKNDELELLATVDLAMEDLRREERPASLETVKEVIGGHPEWEAKLNRSIFFDENIVAAIESCRLLFPSGEFETSS